MSTIVWDGPTDRTATTTNVWSGVRRVAAAARRCANARRPGGGSFRGQFGTHCPQFGFEFSDPFPGLGRGFTSGIAFGPEHAGSLTPEVRAGRGVWAGVRGVRSAGAWRRQARRRGPGSGPARPRVAFLLLLAFPPGAGPLGAVRVLFGTTTGRRGPTDRGFAHSTPPPPSTPVIDVRIERSFASCAVERTKGYQSTCRSSATPSSVHNERMAPQSCTTRPV